MVLANRFFIDNKYLKFSVLLLIIFIIGFIVYKKRKNVSGFYTESINETAFTWHAFRKTNQGYGFILSKKYDNQKYFISEKNLDKYINKGVRDVDQILFIKNDLVKKIVKKHN